MCGVTPKYTLRERSHRVTQVLQQRVHTGRLDGPGHPGVSLQFLGVRFQTDLWLPARRHDVFAFFADAANLESITPPWLRFEVATPMPVSMARGALIDYRLRIHGIPLRWRAEITVWEPPHRFVDEQRHGPYRRWVHTHTFIEERGGTRISDEVDFEAPGPRFVNRLVMRDVRRIFEYRGRALHKLFA